MTDLAYPYYEPSRVFEPFSLNLWEQWTKSNAPKKTGHNFNFLSKFLANNQSDYIADDKLRDAIENDPLTAQHIVNDIKDVKWLDWEKRVHYDKLVKFQIGFNLAAAAITAVTAVTATMFFALPLASMFSLLGASAMLLTCAYIQYDCNRDTLAYRRSGRKDRLDKARQGISDMITHNEDQDGNQDKNTNTPQNNFAQSLSLAPA